MNKTGKLSASVSIMLLLIVTFSNVQTAFSRAAAQNPNSSKSLVGFLNLEPTQTPTAEPVLLAGTIPGSYGALNASAYTSQNTVKVTPTPNNLAIPTTSSPEISIQGNPEIPTPTAANGMVLSDGQFVYGPNVGSFRLNEYFQANAPHLLSYAESLYERSEYFSINPKVYLTLLEMHANLLSNPDMAKTENPFDFNNGNFIAQIDELSKTMFEAYYLHLYTYSSQPPSERKLPVLIMKSGNGFFPTPETNAGTYAIMAALAKIEIDENFAILLDNKSPLGFYQTYQRLFPGDDPLSSTNHIYIPNDINALAAPSDLLQLPFPRGEYWQFNGVHDALGASPGVAFANASSIDFSPGWPVWNTDTSNYWVVAATSGVPIKISNCNFKITRSDGWETVYYHLENIQAFSGSINQNDRIGNIANTKDEAICDKGDSSGPHVHFTLKYNGAYTALNNTPLSNWYVHSGRWNHDMDHNYMWLEKSGTKMYANSWLLSEAPGSSGSTCYTLSISWIGSGTATASPSNSSGCASGKYHAGEVINLTAYPASGWHLDHWTATDSLYSDRLTMPASSRWVIANFLQNSSSCPSVSGEVRLYNITNCGGTYVYANAAGNWDISSNFNDTAQSIAIPSGWSVRLFKDYNFTGANVCIPSTTNDLHSYNYSDGTTAWASATYMIVYNQSNCPSADRPDLVIQSIAASTVSPTVNQPLTFYVTVKNQGTAAIASSFYVDLFIDSPPGSCPTDGIHFWEVTSLAVGATQEFTYTYPGFSSTGAHTVYAIADSYCSITESNEGNNILGPGTLNVIQVSAPSANMDSWPQTGTAPFTSAFHIVSTANITSCSWNYGDGQTGTSCASLHNHTYTNAGTYSPSLTVRGPGGTDNMVRSGYIIVSAGIPSAPGLSVPSNGSSNPYNYNLNFQWNASANATTYLLEWWGGSYTAQRPCGWSSATSCQIGQIIPNNTYYWHVMARNSAGDSAWSATSSFTVQAQPCYTLTKNASPAAGGTVNANPAPNCNSSTQYTSGTIVSLTAVSNSGYLFYSWSGDASGTGNPVSVTMSANKVVAANYSVNNISYSLTISKSGTGSGTITSSPSGINCGATCAYAYALNTIVTLTASPTSPATFAGWSGACTGTGTCSVTMSTARSVTATFNAPGNQTLTVSKSGTGAGIVTSSPAGINCGSTCATAFTYNALVTLTASPANGSTFSGWGDACSGTGTCSVSMSAARSVTASFTATNTNQTLTVSKSGTGAGTVTSSPAGISCGATCATAFAYNSVVTLTASPASGSTFSGWSGACSGTGNCSVTMSAARSVTATFIATNTNQTLTVSKTGTGTGTVTSSSAGINCGSTCATAFAYNSVVTLTASPVSGSTFSGWSGACSGTGTCSVTMSAARVVTASFLSTAATTTVLFPIAQGSDDAGMVYYCAASVNANEVYFGKCTDGTSITSGFRFANVTIPPGAQIVSANLKFIVDGTYISNQYVLFNGESSGNAPTFSDLSLPANRVRTNATINWPIFPSDVWTFAETRSSPDLSPIIQEIVNRSDWHSNNALTIIARDGTLPGTPASWASRRVMGFERMGAAYAAHLEVTYKQPPATYNLKVTKSGTGTVISSPAGINCGTACAKAFNTGTIVTLSATPAAGFVFAGWNSPCSGTAKCVVTMNAANEVMAVFKKELAQNGGLNHYPTNTSMIPTGWAIANFAPTDGKFTSLMKEGAASLKIAGAAGKTKTLTQTLVLSGSSGQTLTFSYWAKGTSLPAAGLCQGQIILYNGATAVGTYLLKCPAGVTYAWQQASLNIKTLAAFTKVIIKFTYTKTSGNVLLDAISLIR